VSLVHVDVKRLGRIEGGAGKRAFRSPRRQRHNPTRTDLEGKRRHYLGFEYVHVCVDEYRRLAYAEVLPDEKATTRGRLPATGGRLPTSPRHPGRALC
jgi:hypothetical protein